MRGKVLFLLALFSMTLYAQKNEKPTEDPDKLEAELAFQIITSKPKKGASPNNDPALMLSFGYRVISRLSIGLGGGLQSPHFNTTLVPAYVQGKYLFLEKQQVYVRTRLGKFIPLAPKEFKGGLFSEVVVGYVIRISGRPKYTISAGFSRQRMTRINQDFWWQTDRKTEYRFNRLVVGVGMVF